MPAPAVDRVRLVHSGDIKTSQTWSWGLTLKPTTVANPTQSDLDSWLTNVATDSTSMVWTAGILGLLSAATRATKVDAYWYDESSTTARLHSQYLYAPAKTGTGSPVMPTQASICCSLLSSVPSRQTRGRFYFPATALALATTHLVSTTNTDAIANALATYINTSLQVRLLAGSNMEVGIESRAGARWSPATILSVDNEMDIQRRRANKLFGDYKKQVAI